MDQLKERDNGRVAHCQANKHTQAWRSRVEVQEPGDYKLKTVGK